MVPIFLWDMGTEAIGGKERDAEIRPVGMIYVAIRVCYLILACESVTPDICQSSWIWLNMDEDTAL